MKQAAKLPNTHLYTALKGAIEENRNRAAVNIAKRNWLRNTPQPADKSNLTLNQKSDLLLKALVVVVLRGFLATTTKTKNS